MWWPCFASKPSRVPRSDGKIRDGRRNSDSVAPGPETVASHERGPANRAPSGLARPGRANTGGNTNPPTRADFRPTGVRVFLVSKLPLGSTAPRSSAPRASEAELRCGVASRRSLGTRIADNRKPTTAMQRFPPIDLQNLAAAIATAAGLAPADAAILADSLVDADLHGISTHGISRLNIYVRRCSAA